MFRFTLAVSVGLAASTRLQVVEKQQHHLHEDWVVLEKASAGEMHQVSIAVKQKNLDLLHDKLMEVSMPDSPQRGQYLSWDEAHKLTANPDATASVLSWLKENGVEVESVHKHGHFIKAQTNVSTWERLLSTSFSRMTDEKSAPVVRATTDVSLPENIAELVEGIFMTTQVPLFNPPPIITPKDPAENADNDVTPAKLKSFYGITGVGSASISQSVYEGIGQTASPSDLSAFQKQFGLDDEAIAKDIGGHVSNFICKINPNSCAEANLDVQYMLAVASGTPLVYSYDSSQGPVFEDWITNLAADPSPPVVNSISYGAPEPKLAASTLNTFNTEAMKLGVQGVSIFVSSGDDGAPGSGARGNPGGCGYEPSFPATSPYITAVGATQGGPNGGEEVACSGNTGGTITTGGGFSTNFDQPKWQASAVADFLSKDSSAVAGFNAAGRGYPDVAMAGFNYEVVIAGKTYQVSGTSASSPVVAGFATLVNSRLVEQGKPTIGFANPTIYANGGAFNDIVQGDNKCSAAGPSGATCCSEGFNAVEGWDATTGWGSVRFADFAQIFGASSSVVV